MKQELVDTLNAIAQPEETLQKEASEQPTGILKQAAQRDPAIALALHKKAKAVLPSTQRFIWQNGKRVPNPSYKAPAPTPKPKAEAPKGGIPQEKGGAGGIRQMYKELDNQ